MSRHFAAMSSGISEAAITWPDTGSELILIDKESDRYAHVSDMLLDRISTDYPSLPDRLTNHTVRHSLKVMLRYCQIAAHAARRDDQGNDELLRIMQDPRSFEPLSAIATQQSKLATRVETDYELRSYGRPVYPYILGKYALDKGYVELDGLEHSTLINRINMAQEGHSITAGQCPAHQADVLQPILGSLSLICYKDPDLFNRTIES